MATCNTETLNWEKSASELVSDMRSVSHDEEECEDQSDTENLEPLLPIMAYSTC